MARKKSIPEVNLYVLSFIDEDGDTTYEQTFTSLFELKHEIMDRTSRGAGSHFEVCDEHGRLLFTEEDAHELFESARRNHRNYARRMNEGTVKKRNGKWTNRSKSGKEFGEFRTKKAADAQRRAMFAEEFYYYDGMDRTTNLLDVDFLPCSIKQYVKTVPNNIDKYKIGARYITGKCIVVVTTTYGKVAREVSFKYDKKECKFTIDKKSNELFGKFISNIEHDLLKRIDEDSFLIDPLLYKNESLTESVPVNYDDMTDAEYEEYLEYLLQIYYSNPEYLNKKDISDLDCAGLI